MNSFVNVMVFPEADPERICEFRKFQCEQMSATMVGRQRKILILDELKQSYNAFPHLKYNVKIDNNFDQSCHSLIRYYGFSI